MLIGNIVDKQPNFISIQDQSNTLHQCVVPPKTEVYMSKYSVGQQIEFTVKPDKLTGQKTLTFITPMGGHKNNAGGYAPQPMVQGYTPPPPAAPVSYPPVSFPPVAQPPTSYAKPYCVSNQKDANIMKMSVLKSTTTLLSSHKHVDLEKTKGLIKDYYNFCLSLVAPELVEQHQEIVNESIPIEQPMTNFGKVDGNQI